MDLFKFDLTDSRLGGHSYSGWYTGYKLCNGETHFKVTFPQGVFADLCTTISSIGPCGGECECTQKFYPFRWGFGVKIRNTTGYTGPTLEELVELGEATPRQKLIILKKRYDAALQQRNNAGSPYNSEDNDEKKQTDLHSAKKALLGIRSQIKEMDISGCQFLYNDDISACDRYLRSYLPAGNRD